MKVILLFLLLLSFRVDAQVFGDTAYRKYSDSTGDYLVRYEYDSGSWFYTYDRKIGYLSIIHVYKLVDCKCIVPRVDRVFIREFNDIYVPDIPVKIRLF